MARSILESIYQATRAPGAAAATPAVPAPVTPRDPVFVNSPASIVGPQKDRSILDVIGGLIAPEANSFWANASQYGLDMAKTKQAEYTAAKRKEATAQSAAELALSEAQEKAKFHDQVTGNAVLRRDDQGNYTVAFQAPTEVERLIEQWKAAPEGFLKDLLARAIRGYQYSDEFLEAKSKRKQEEIRTNNATKRFAPRAGGAKGGPALTPSEPPPWAK